MKNHLFGVVFCFWEMSETATHLSLIKICSQSSSSHTRMEHAADIFFYRPDFPRIDTSNVFNVSEEKGGLRVKNDNVNCLFKSLSRKEFDEVYNLYLQHLNLNFEPLLIGCTVCELTNAEQEKLNETIITSWIYYYTINDVRVEVSRSDLTHPQTTDEVLWILDEKYGVDTSESLIFGAWILRQNKADYAKTVAARRRHYTR